MIGERSRNASWPFISKPAYRKVDRGYMKQANQPLADQASRQRKAQKILAVLAQQTQFDLGKLNCVDIGCAYGLISQHLAARFRFTLGIEYERNALVLARPLAHSHLAFMQADACQLPLPADSVDVVVCAQVYEHVYNDGLLFVEIWRVLKPGGLCFFSGPNRLFPYEYHWRLLFVHWLPRRWSQSLAQRIARKPVAELHLRTYWSLKRALARFQLTDYTAEMIRHPERYALDDSLHRLSWLRRLPAAILRRLVILAPNFNWVLTKPVNGPVR